MRFQGYLHRISVMMRASSSQEVLHVAILLPEKHNFFDGVSARGDVRETQFQAHASQECSGAWESFYFLVQSLSPTYYFQAFTNLMTDKLDNFQLSVFPLVCKSI